MDSDILRNLFPLVLLAIWWIVKSGARKADEARREAAEEQSAAQPGGEQRRSVREENRPDTGQSRAQGPLLKPMREGLQGLFEELGAAVEADMPGKTQGRISRTRDPNKESDSGRKEAGTRPLDRADESALEKAERRVWRESVREQRKRPGGSSEESDFGAVTTRRKTRPLDKAAPTALDRAEEAEEDEEAVSMEALSEEKPRRDQVGSSWWRHGEQVGVVHRLDMRPERLVRPGDLRGRPIRRAIVLSEILSKPVALRENHLEH